MGPSRQFAPIDNDPSFPAVEVHELHPVAVDSPPRLLSGESIVCFAGEDWWYHNTHSNQHLMQELARNGNRVLFVNSTGLRAPNLKNRFAWKKILRKLTSLLIYLRRAEPGLYVVTPLALPLTRRMRGFVMWLNPHLITFQVRLVSLYLGMRRPIAWVASPAAATSAIRMRRNWARLLVYYCVDNFAFFSEVDTALIRSLDSELQRNADLTLFTGRRLFEERRQHGNAHLLPHGVEFSLFAKAQSAQLEVPAELRSLPQPIAGYVGAVEGLDLDTIAYVARQNPHVSLVFIGNVSMDVSPLAAFSNVHFLGKRPYERLVEYLQCFRVCLLCYSRGDTFNDYRSPKKLLEYLAGGKPLVSLKLAELDAWGDLVYQSETAEQFNAQLQRALSENDLLLRNKRVEAARRRDWREVAAEASRLIEKTAGSAPPG
jgi:glycosyltransferase involved in cell wall biosynthesis